MTLEPDSSVVSPPPRPYYFSNLLATETSICNCSLRPSPATDHTSLRPLHTPPTSEYGNILRLSLPPSLPHWVSKNTLGRSPSTSVHFHFAVYCYSFPHRSTILSPYVNLYIKLAWPKRPEVHPPCPWTTVCLEIESFFPSPSRRYISFPVLEKRS